MSDVVVTVPKTFKHPCAPGMVGLGAWIHEGDAAGEPWSGTLWEFSTWGHKPNIVAGERVYIVCEDRLRGYAPLVDLEFDPAHGGNGMGAIRLIRGGDAVAVTIPQKILGFRGWRYVFWNQEIEYPFANWRI